MTTLTHRAEVRLIHAAVKAAGAETPDPIASAERDIAAVTNAGHTEAPDLAGAFVAAVLAGRDPAADKAVQRAVTATALRTTELDGALERWKVARTNAAYAEAAPELVATWRHAAATAAAQLAAAHETLGDLALDDAAEVLRIGGDAGARWADATAAVKLLETLKSGFAALAPRIGVDLRPQHRPLVLADMTPDQCRRHAQSDAWDLVRDGLSIDFADPETFRRRLDALADQQADADQARLDTKPPHAGVIDDAGILR